MTEGNPTVEEARAQLVRDYTEDGWEIPVMERALNALIEAVRQEERERMEAALRMAVNRSDTSVLAFGPNAVLERVWNNPEDDKAYG